jgi:hypothetical protein
MATISQKLQQQYEDEMALINKTKKVSSVKPPTTPVVKKPTTPVQTVSTVNPNAALDRNWNQNQAQFNLQSNQYDQSYKLALNQLDEQEKEEVGQTERLAQQSYLAREKAERVLPNQLGMMGAANTGYENVARQNINQQYQNQYEQFMNNLALAKAAIKRARDSQSMNYNQQKQSLQLNQQQTYDNYVYDKSQKKTTISQPKVTFDTVVQNALSYGTADRASDYLQSMIDQKVIAIADARRIYNEFGQYWAYYNQ